MIVCLEQGRHNLAGGTFQSLFCILLYRSSINSQRNAHALSLCKYTLAPQANCRSVCPSIHPPVCLFVCLSTSMSVCLHTCLSVFINVRLSTHLFVSLQPWLYLCLSVRLSTYMSVHLSFRPSVHPPVCVCLVHVCLSSSGGHPARDPSLTVGKRGRTHYKS